MGIRGDPLLVTEKQACFGEGLGRDSKNSQGLWLSLLTALGRFQVIGGAFPGLGLAVLLWGLED